MGLLKSIKVLFTSATDKIENTAEKTKSVVENSAGSIDEIKNVVTNVSNEVTESEKKSQKTHSRDKDITVKTEPIGSDHLAK